MFKSKKRGLRSFRKTVILFVIILIIPLIILFIAKTFFAVPPIFPEYQDWIKKAKSDENGYLFFEGAENIAKRMYCGYFSMTIKNLIPDNPDKYLFSKNIFKLEKWPPEMYLRIFKFLIKENLFIEEINAYTQRKYPVSTPTNNREHSCIYPETNWAEDFHRNSLGVLGNIKRANEKDFFLPYVSHPYTPYSIFDSNITLIELVNVLMLLHKGDYQDALNWIDTMNQLALHIEPIYQEESSPIGQQLSVLNMLTLYPSLPDVFYDDLLCRLLEIKDKINKLEFKTVYQYALFYFENSFVRRQAQLQYSPPHILIPRSISLFFAYNEISRALDKQREVIETSTWKDIEDAVFYNRGKLHTAITAIKSSIGRSFADTGDYWMFWSGEKYRNILLKYNYSKCSVYGSILTVLLEKHFKQNGLYPLDLDLKEYFSEEELLWMDEYLDIYISPEKYYIDYYPIPKKEWEGKKSQIFRYRNSYRVYSNF